MKTKQYNLKIPEILADATEAYVAEKGYKNLQEVALEGIRRQINEQYDDSFTKKEMELIDEIIEVTLEKKDFVSEKELMEVLSK